MLAAVRAGNRLSVAARYADVSAQTLNEWLRRGRGLDVRPATPELVELVEDIERARAVAEVAALATVRKAMSINWRAAAWWLERTNPDWRRRTEWPEPEASTLVPTGPGLGTVYISGETLKRLATEGIRVERREVEVDEATLARRARLVESG